MDWTICSSPCATRRTRPAPSDSILSFEEQRVLYRSDTKAILSVVGGRYQVVQPREVLEFYRDLTGDLRLPSWRRLVCSRLAKVLGAGPHRQGDRHQGLRPGQGLPAAGDPHATARWPRL